MIYYYYDYDYYDYDDDDDDYYFLIVVTLHIVNSQKHFCLLLRTLLLVQCNVVRYDRSATNSTFREIVMFSLC